MSPKALIAIFCGLIILGTLIASAMFMTRGSRWVMRIAIMAAFTLGVVYPDIKGEISAAWSQLWVKK